MCEPILIGAAIGGGLGLASGGGVKGAVLGAGFGALGGAALGPGAGLGGGFGAGPGASIAQFGNVGAAGGGGLFGGLFGGGGIGSFLTSPGFSVGSQLVGFGVQAIGANQQASYQRALIANQQAEIRNRQIAIEQDIKQRGLQADINEGILGNQGDQARGALRAEAAGRGVLVDAGSEADKTEQLAGDVAFAKLVARQEQKLQNRQDRIIASGLQNDSALLDFKSSDISRANTFGQIGGALKTASSLSSKFRFNNNGQLAFRT